jgi:lipopolysaccharide/colanic/teichoic acid biosynthesis glycosyltransferase
VELDEYYLKHRSFFFDLQILFITILKVFKTEGVSH